MFFHLTDHCCKFETVFYSSLRILFVNHIHLWELTSFKSTAVKKFRQNQYMCVCGWSSFICQMCYKSVYNLTSFQLPPPLLLLDSLCNQANTLFMPGLTQSLSQAVTCFHFQLFVQIVLWKSMNIWVFQIFWNHFWRALMSPIFIFYQQPTYTHCWASNLERVVS